MCPEEVVKYPNHSAETFNTTWTHEGSREAPRQAKSRSKIDRSSFQARNSPAPQTDDEVLMAPNGEIEW